MFIVDSKRIATMRLRLSKASHLIDNDAFLPMFRRRQKEYQEEFEHSILVAESKDKPARYFASMWSKKNFEKTVQWIRSLINQLKHKAIRAKHALAEKRREQEIQQATNAEGRLRVTKLYRRHRLLGNRRS